MNNESNQKKSSLVEFLQAISAILGVPIVLFTIINNIFPQPTVSLIVAIITGIALTIWLAYYRKINFAYLAIAWLSLLVIILLGFVIWPNTMTIEGFVNESDGKPVINETVKYFDYRNQTYETQTDQNGFYQFVDVPTGKYKIRVRTTEIQGETRGLLVRVVQQSISVSPETGPTNTPTPTPTNTSMPVKKTDTPTSTSTPTNTSSPTNTPSSTPTPTATIDSDPTVYDNFNNPTYDGKWNKSLWADNSFPGATAIEQQNGNVIISRQSSGSSILRTRRPGKWTLDQLGFIEAKIMLGSNIETLSGGSIGIGIDKYTSQDNWWSFCVIGGGQDLIEAWVNCHTDGNIHGKYSTDSFPVQYNTWHIMRIEIDPDTTTITYFIDGQQVGSYTPKDPETFKNTQFSPLLNVWSEDGGLTIGYADYVRIGEFR